MQGPGRVSPVPHEVIDDSKLRDNINARRAHAGIGVGSNLGIERSRRVRIGKHGISFLEKRKGQESGANLSEVRTGQKSCRKIN